ncbi:MAG: hypothetical protein ACRC14_18745 [Paracoccaceae bacterium]
MAGAQRQSWCLAWMRMVTVPISRSLRLTDALPDRGRPRVAQGHWPAFKPAARLLYGREVPTWAKRHSTRWLFSLEV